MTKIKPGHTRLKHCQVKKAEPSLLKFIVS